MVYYFNHKLQYYRNEQFNSDKIIDEYLHGWCFYFQEILYNKIPNCEKYCIFEKTCETNGEYYDDHQIIKYKNYYIDIRGIFNETEMIEEHKKEYVKMARKYKHDSNIECFLSKVDNDTKNIVEDCYNNEIIQLTNNIVDSLLNDIITKI